MAPSSISVRATTIAGWNRVHIASIAKTPVPRAVAMMSSAPATVAVNVFSTRTALPACRAATAIRVVLRVRGGDVEGIDVRRVDDLAVRPVRRLEPELAQKARARSSDREAAATATAPGA